MTKTSLRKRFIPLGSWAPDSPEFSPGFLDQIVNALPVFGINRVVQRLSELSRCEEDRRVTGTYVHRISVELSGDLMQPDFSEEQVLTYPPKEGFQTVPALLDEYYQALRGLTPDAASTILLIPYTTEEILYGTFSPAKRIWNTTDDLIARIQFRISKGFTGAYTFTIEIGTTVDPTNPASFTPLVPPAEFTKSGNLQDAPDHLNSIQQTATIVIPNADFTDPGNQHRWAWRIKQTMAETGTLERFFNVEEIVGAFTTDAQTGKVSFYANEAGSNVPANMVASIQGQVAGAWRPDPNGSTGPPGFVLSGDEDLTTFVRSVPIWSTASTGYGFFMKMDLPQIVNLHNHKIKFTYSLERTGQVISIGLFQGRGTTLIQRWGGPDQAPGTNFGVASDGQVVTVTIEDIQPILLRNITDWSDVWVFFFTHRPPPTTTAIVNTLRPRLGAVIADAGYGQSHVWTLVGPNYVAALRDASDLTGVSQPDGVVPSWFQVLLEPFSGPKEAVSGARVYVRMANQLGVSSLEIRLTDSSSGASWATSTFVPLNPVTAEYEFTVPAGALAQFTGFSDVILRITAKEGSTRHLDVTDVWVEVDSGYSSRSTLYGITYFAPEVGENDAPAPIDVSWLRLDGPVDDATNQQDTLRAYLGTVEKPDSATQEGRIYEVTSPDFSVWDDVTRAVPYSSNVRDKSFSFTGFGSMVIATNYNDEVQVKYEVDTDFFDLIGFDTVHVAIPNYATDGGVKPRARFAATISSFLCLANCDPLSVLGVAQPYTFWCSRYAQPQYFHVGLIEWQSSAFQLAGSPGEITGLTGGDDYGLVFKENSVTRMDYVGLPEIFHPTQLAGNQGTVQPRSIVKVEDDVYFFGGGGIYAVREGKVVEEIAAQGAVRKFLFDAQFEDFSVSTLASDFESESSVRVVGGYDSASGCIMWSFLSKNNAEWFKSDAILVYSPRENKFSFIQGNRTGDYDGTERIISVSDIFGGNDLMVQGFLSLGNRAVNGETYLQRTILAVHEIPPKISSFSGMPVYPQMFRSNTIASSYFGAPVGVEMVIQRVRPVMAVERISDIPPHTIWIEGNQSPAVGDGTGSVRKVLSSKANKDGWIDLDLPLSGEFFKFASVFDEYTDQIVKEVHGWQICYRIAGDN